MILSTLKTLLWEWSRKNQLPKNSGYEPVIGFLESDEATGNPMIKRAPTMNEFQSMGSSQDVPITKGPESLLLREFPER